MSGLLSHLNFRVQADIFLLTGTVHQASNAKVGVFTCGIDIAQTETKGTVLLKNSEELLNFSRGEEKHMEKVLAVFISPRLLSSSRLIPPLPLPLDLPRNCRLRSQSSHRRFLSRRTRTPLPKPSRHPRRQNPLQIRPSPGLPRCRSVPSRALGRPNPRRNGPV